MAALTSNSWGSPQTAVLSQDTGSGGANGHLRLVYWCLMGFSPPLATFFNLESLITFQEAAPHRPSPWPGNIPLKKKQRGNIPWKFWTIPFRRKIANFVKIRWNLNMFTKFTQMFRCKSRFRIVLNLVSRENGTPFRASLRLCELLSNLSILWLQPTVDPMAGRRWKTRVENGRKRYFHTNQLAVAGLLW